MPRSTACSYTREARRGRVELISTSLGAPANPASRHAVADKTSLNRLTVSIVLIPVHASIAKAGFVLHWRMPVCAEGGQIRHDREVLQHTAK